MGMEMSNDKDVHAQEVAVSRVLREEVTDKQREALEAVVSRVLRDAGIPNARKSPEAHAVREGWYSARAYYMHEMWNSI
jgi:hypothetical protein